MMEHFDPSSSPTKQSVQLLNDGKKNVYDGLLQANAREMLDNDGEML